MTWLLRHRRRLLFTAALTMFVLYWPWFLRAMGLLND